MRQQLVAVLAVGVLGVGSSIAAGSSIGAGLGAERSAAVAERSSEATADGARGGRHIAAMRLADGRTVGSVRFLRDRAGTRVVVSLRMPDDLAAAGGTFHGFHVHANSDPANGSGCVADPDAPSTTWFASADGHYTEPGAVHGHHTGDMPVVYLQEEGRATATFVTDRFEPQDVVGRAVIVHAGPDNYGNIPLGDEPTDYTPVDKEAALDLTNRTGNAGDRLACGVVEQ